MRIPSLQFALIAALALCGWPAAAQIRGGANIPAMQGHRAQSGIALSWQASTSSGVTSYNIYRDGVKIGSVNAPATSYLDTSAIGKTSGYWRYWVTAYDSGDSLESPPSNSVFVGIK
jgi:hypothetical protein